MHELDRLGELSGTREQLARIGRCSTVEITQALTDLQTTGAADVTERNGVFTVVCRRMQRERKSRQNGAVRIARFRQKRDGNKIVTPPSSSSSSGIPPTPPGGADTAAKIWRAFPAHRRGALDDFRAAWSESGLEPMAAAVMETIKARKASSEWKEKAGQYVPKLAKFLREWSESSSPPANAWFSGAYGEDIATAKHLRAAAEKAGELDAFLTTYPTWYHAVHARAAVKE